MLFGCGVGLGFGVVTFGCCVVVCSAWVKGVN